jgi:uncharacterized SAM-binding protein YcdF (DUF218 family)
MNGGSARGIIGRIGEFLMWRLLFTVVVLGILIGVAYVFRVPLLRTVSEYLVKEDPHTATDAIYVLGGAPLERGLEGARLLANGVAPVVYCTGELVPTVLVAEGIDRTEGELTRNVAIDAGADPDQVKLIDKGTSTWEESEAIIAHAMEAGFTNITIISTEFHLRRVRRVFRQQAQGTNVQVHVRGAPSLVYDRHRWWESEEGLLMVNNEYMKLLYYWLRY